MKRIFKGIFITASFLACSSGYGRGASSNQNSNAGQKPWLRCVSAPPASTVSTPNLPSALINYGFVFGLETNNGNLLSIDTYQLNSQGLKIKQVGHAEAQSQTSSNSEGNTLNIQNSSDSPMVFLLSSSAANADSKFPAVISTVLFSGHIISTLSVNCKMTGQTDQVESSSPSTSQN